MKRIVHNKDGSIREEPFELNIPPEVRKESRKLEIMSLLSEIDRKKIRAITEAILTGDTARLRQCEAEAEVLREELRSLNV